MCSAPAEPDPPVFLRTVAAYHTGRSPRTWMNQASTRCHSISSDRSLHSCSDCRSLSTEAARRDRKWSLFLLPESNSWWCRACCSPRPDTPVERMRSRGDRRRCNCLPCGSRRCDSVPRSSRKFLCMLVAEAVGAVEVENNMVCSASDIPDRQLGSPAQDSTHSWGLCSCFPRDASVQSDRTSCSRCHNRHWVTSLPEDRAWWIRRNMEAVGHLRKCSRYASIPRLFGRRIAEHHRHMCHNRCWTERTRLSSRHPTSSCRIPNREQARS